MKVGTTIWLTGLSSSGKSTIAKKIEKHYKDLNINMQLLDGDVLRENMGNMFGYSREDRINVAKIYRTMAKLLNQNGIHVIVAAIAPYEEIRNENRKKFQNYIEIFLDCPIEECVKRDVKGLYRRAISGEEHNVIGIDEKFEYPQNSDIIINTKDLSIDETFEILIDYINKNLLK